MHLRGLEIFIIEKNKENIIVDITLVELEDKAFWVRCTRWDHVYLCFLLILK